jgi:hypothetical protein
LLGFALLSCSNIELDRTHHFFNPVLFSGIKKTSDNNYCFYAGNNSTTTKKYEVCHSNLDKVKECYLKLGVLQRSLRGIKERKNWSRYRPPYIIRLTRSGDSSGNKIYEFRKCGLIKNKKFLYNNIDPFSEISSEE